MGYTNHQEQIIGASDLAHSTAKGNDENILKLGVELINNELRKIF